MIRIHFVIHENCCRLQNVRIMFERMTLMRQELRRRLEIKTRANIWKFITDQKGMFCYIRLPSTSLPVDMYLLLMNAFNFFFITFLTLYYSITVGAVDILRHKYHVYLMSSGRINISGLNTKNLDYVVDAIVSTLEKLNQYNNQR